MNALLFLTILALAAPIFGEEVNAEAAKRQDKRGVVGVGYGGAHYPAAFGTHGLTGYPGYGTFGGFGHGYVPSAAPLYGLGHGIAAAPAIAHGYTAPLSHYSHGYNSASLLAAATPWRTAGYHGLHGLGYVNGW